MKLLVTAALAASLIATNLYAADAAAPLAPGKPAGVAKAQDMGDFWWIAGGVFVAAIVIVAATGSSGGTPFQGASTATT
jgi:hypothetical protein